MDKAKQKTISAMILKAISEGRDVRDAVDSVLGAGRYDLLVSNLYDNLNAKG